MSIARENARFLEHAGFPGDLLGGPRVALELHEAAASHPDGARAFMLAANILCRLFRHVRLVGPDCPIGPNPWGLTSLSDLAAPLAAISQGSVRWGGDGAVDAVLGIGGPARTTAAQGSFVSYSGWSFAVDAATKESCGELFGALGSACYGSAQLFLKVAEAAGALHRSMRPFSFCLLDYASGGGGAELPATVRLSPSHLVGVGAVGCAALYALDHLPRLEGDIVPIDNDGVDDTNLQRYVLMRRVDVGHRKVTIAHDLLNAPGLRVEPHDETFDVYHQRERPRLELLLSPVDSEDGRRRLAAYLPRTALNVATGGSTVTVSRHHFGDGRMCLACLYPAAKGETEWQVIMARDLGLPLSEVLSTLETNEPVDTSMLRRVEKHRGLNSGELAEFEGKALQSLYQRAVCGTSGVKTPGGTVISPLAFISAMGGVLLAAEWVKQCTPELAPHRLDNYFRLDLFHPPNPDMKLTRRAAEGCICQDPGFRAVYRERWGVGI